MTIENRAKIKSQVAKLLIVGVIWAIALTGSAFLQNTYYLIGVLVLGLVVFVVMAMQTLRNVAGTFEALEDTVEKIVKGTPIKAQSLERDGEINSVLLSLQKVSQGTTGLAQLVSTGVTNSADVVKFEGVYKETALSLEKQWGKEKEQQAALLEMMGKLNLGESFDPALVQKCNKELADQLLVMRAGAGALAVQMQVFTENLAKGRWDQRLDLSQTEGVWKQCLAHLDDTVVRIQRPILKGIETLEGMGTGKDACDWPEKEEGIFLRFKEGIQNRTKTQVALIKDIIAGYQALSEKKLDYQLKLDYQGNYAPLKVAFNAMAKSFQDIIQEVDGMSSQVIQGSGQIAESNTYLAEGATQQSNAIENIVQSVSTVAGEIENNSSTADTANTMAISTVDKAQKGNEEMKSMLDAMVQINKASSDISRIIKVIDDIAFQTNLLALNAAVEAARAGQHGKGFAVVAEEVRSLASRSTQAAQETTDLIQGSIQKATEGMKIANVTADTLKEIVENVSEISTLIERVASGSKNQSSSIYEINDAITRISEVNHTNTATIQEGAASAQELHSLALVFKSFVAEFDTGKQTQRVESPKKVSSPPVRTQKPKSKTIPFETIQRQPREERSTQAAVGMEVPNHGYDFDQKDLGRY